MAIKKSDKILWNKEEIKEFLSISDYTFRKYVRLGMPARLEGRDWIAHKENLEEWFKRYTFIPASKFTDPEDHDAASGYPVK